MTKNVSSASTKKTPQELESERIDKILESSEINDSSDIPDIEPIIKINGKIFLTRQEISFIGGLAKAGKSTVAANIIAACLSYDNKSVDMPSIEVEGPSNKKVIYIDTEQPKSKTNHLRKMVREMLGVQKQPENLLVLNFRPQKRQDKIKAIERLRIKHKDNVHLWIIDGIADLVSSPNNEEECYEIIANYMSYAETDNTAYLFFLHQNIGVNEKLRGHLGSEASRKCAGLMTVKKDKDQVHSIVAKDMRYDGNFETVFFKWNKGVKRMTELSVDESEQYKKEHDRETMRIESHKKMAQQCLPPGEEISSGEMVSRIMLHAPRIENKTIKKTAAINRIKEYEKHGFIVRKEIDKNVLYSLAI